MSLKLVPCRYYKQGQCSRGASCQYSHDLSVKGTPTCVYFLRGYCAKASKCTFRHEKPEPEKKKPITKQFIRPKVDVPKPKPIPKNDVLEFVPGQGQYGLTLASRKIIRRYNGRNLGQAKRKIRA